MKKIKAVLMLLLLAGTIGLKTTAQTKNLYMVADAHLDTQWDWDVQTTIDQYVKNTLVDNFALFKKYPTYQFNFEGAIKYMWAKEYYPELYAQLKTYVASGRWNICGSSLDANDIIVPSIESQIRNILIGQTFYKKEFGKKSNDIFLPDCFGFGYTLPSIMNHCGLIGFSTQKLSWGGIVTPFKIGSWQGVDGSRILAACSAGGYGDRFSEDVSNKSELIDWVNETGSKTNGKHYVGFRYYGTGDRGGAPEDATVGWIEKSITAPTGPLKVTGAKVTDFYDQYFPSLSDFPLYNGELIMTTHGTGCYTSRTMMKRWNRKNELLADAAERSAVIADWMGGLPYPSAELNENWIRLLWHQFHDDLTGTSCTRAYTFSQNDEVLCQKKFSSVLKNAVGAGVRGLNTQTQGTPVVVYNPLSIDRNDVVEVNLRVSSKTDFIRVFDKQGNERPAQVILSNDTLVKFLFVAAVKPLGYEVYDARPSATASPVTDNELKISSNSLENSIYKVTINEKGDIGSITDKSNGNRQLISSSIRLALLKSESAFWASWEIPYKTVTNAPRGYVDGIPEISIEENGPVRVTLKITRRKDNSTFVQYVRLTNSDTKKRVDVENDVNWKTKQTLLKAVFTMASGNPFATYDLGLGVIKRPNNSSVRYEVPAQQWADITSTDNAYGVSILNDCKYGWDKPYNNTLRLTLLHSPLSDGGSYKFQEDQDLGNNRFTYSIYGHANTCLEAGTRWEAAKLNQPLMAFEAVKHDGNLGKSFSLLNIDTTQVALMAFKKAETGNDYVLRFYETKGKDASNVKVKFATRILAAKELNGIEEETGDVSFSDSTLLINMKAFQPKSFSVRLAKPGNLLTAPDCKPLPLTFNLDAVSAQTNMTDGNFDGQSNSYSAELLPDTLLSDGIRFVMGPKTAGAKNAIRCSGTKITVPAGYKKLYILAASSSANGSTGQFSVGANTGKLYVPYFSNFVGQASAYRFLAGDTVVSPSYFNQENVAWTGNHMHNGSSQKDKMYIFTYLFKYCLEVPEGATELILPTNTNIVVFAVTAANNANDDTKPTADLVDIQKPEPLVTPTVNHCGVLLSNRKITSASGQTNSNEAPSKAVDGDESTKWCHDFNGDKWMTIDLGQPMSICEWRVKHAAIESENYITKDFKLQKMVGTQWVDVDAVTGNMLNTTDRMVTPFIAQKVRLYITKSGSDIAARIYEFQLFGSTSTDLDKAAVASEPTVTVTPNPVKGKAFEAQISGFEQESELRITITDLNGKTVFRSERKNAPQLNLVPDTKLTGGLYFLNVKGKKAEASCKFLVVE